MNLHQYRANVKKRRVENKKFFSKIRKRKPKDIEFLIQEEDEKAFENINCLDCANCCKTTPSMLTRRDIDRISRHLGMKPGEFSDLYVRVDEDDDYVYRHTPCAFLDEDNSCKIYDVRPKACREYPHTHADKISLAVMEKNVAICPAVYEITEKLKRVYINKLK